MSVRRTQAALEGATYALAAVITTVVFAAAMRLQDADWSVPFVYVGDAVAVQAHAKTVLETGWYESQPLLGAPEGQTYHDFPTADNLHQMAFGLLGTVLPDAATVMNAYYVLGYPLAALTAVWFLRYAGISRPVTIALASLFALSPYHFERHEGHLFLASYWPLPLALGVVLMVLRGERLWARSERVRGPLGFLCGRGAFVLVALALIGTASSYYAFFTGTLLGVAMLLALLRDRSWARLLGAFGAGVALVSTMLANMWPDLAYARRVGDNALLPSRGIAEVEVYALKLVQLLLPSDRHRVPFLREVRRYYNSTFPLPSESPTLGAVAAAGMLVVLAVVVVAAVGGALRRADLVDHPRWVTLRHVSVLATVAFLFATVGGFSSVVAFATESLRGWGRMTIVLALLCLAVVGLVADAVVGWLRGRSSLARDLPARALTVLAAAVVGVVGVVDQTSPLYRPDYAGNAAAWSSDAEYVSALEAALPQGAMVFQAPHIPFPETPPVNGVLDTEQLRMYLHSDELRWSGGGMRGRADVDWAQVVQAQPVPEMLERVAVAGFAAVHLDRRTQVDGGDGLEAAFEEELGAPVVVSRDGRYVAWLLEPLREEVEADLDAEEVEQAREAVVLPVLPYGDTDLVGPQDVDGQRVWTAEVPRPRLLLDNPRDEAVDVVLSFRLRSAGPATSVRVGLPDGTTLDVAPGERVEVTVQAPAGRGYVTFEPTGAGAAELEAARLELADVDVVDPDLALLLP